jgi:hypothetical protein
MLSRTCRLSILITALICAACATPPPEPAMPALVVQPVRLAALTDQRAAYRRRFCQLLDAPWNAPCPFYLTKFDDEPDAAASVELPGAPHPPVNLFVVSGVFSECFPRLQTFGDARGTQATGSVTFFDVPIHGRGSTELNAQIVRSTILAELARQSTPRLNIILSYSKGTADSLAALAESGELAGRIDALLSVAGAVNGSPLADALGTLYASVAAWVPFDACKVTDRGELQSLTRAERLNWLLAHPLPRHPRYYSLVATPTDDRVSPLLRLPYRKLAKLDPRNDGQLMYYDAVIPGSTLLGYLNADHFAVALPLLRWHPVALSVLAQANDFPRQQMLTAALDIILQELHTPHQSSPN